ncbi:MAG: helix-turn-helix domain-containing protein [Candidatus Limnocylindrales bacterium]
MDDQRVAAAFRALRVGRGWRQEDVADAAACSRSAVSRLERGQLSELTFSMIRRIGAAVEVQVELDPRWRRGLLAHLLDQRHAALQNELARRFARMPGWQFDAEVTFAVWGERGSVDLLAWNAEWRALLIVEVKSELVDLQDLLSTLNRKRRLAPDIVRDRRWEPRVVGTWVVLEEGRGNRRRVALYREVLRHSFPADARAMRRWLDRPDRPVAGLSFLTVARTAGARRPLGPVRRATRHGTR